jgi:hypothetical protein
VDVDAGPPAGVGECPAEHLGGGPAEFPVTAGEITATAMTTACAAMTTIRPLSVDPMDMMTTNPRFTI